MLSSVSASLQTRGLGLAALRALPLAVIGCSSDGDVAEPVMIRSADQITEDVGYGPGPSALAEIGRVGGYPLLFCRAETTTAGQLGGYCQRGGGTSAAGTVSSVTGTSTAVPALTGTPDKPYAVKIVVTTAGSNIAATPVVKISLDGGLTYLAPGAVTVSATPQAIGSTGLLLAFTDGTFVLNDFWTAQGANCPTPADASGASVLSFSGTPRDRYQVRIKVTRAASAAGDGTGAVRYSLDDGATYEPEAPVPTSRAVVLGDTGITVTFSAASLVADDEYSFETSAPVFTASALATALAALEEVGIDDHEGIIIVGAIDATYFDEIEASHDRLIAASKPRWILAHTRRQGATLFGESAATWAAAILGASPGFSGQSAELVAVAAGDCTVKDSLHGDAILHRSVALPIAARLGRIDAAEHPGRARTGPLALETLSHDFAASTLSGLDSGGFIGAQSIQGLDGYYATDATRAPAGSDFGEIMRVRVMCLACRVALARMAQEVNESPDVNTDGTIRADVADGLDAAVTTHVAREMGRRVTSVRVQVDRTVNLVTTGRLPFKVRFVPRGYAKAVEIDLGFTLGSN